MRVGCWKGWHFVLGFERPIDLAIVDSVLHRAFAPSRGVC